MAPEVSPHPGDPKKPLRGYTLLSDSWSLGGVLLEMATGIPPWCPFQDVSSSQPYALQARAGDETLCPFFLDPELPFAAALEAALPDADDRAGFCEVLGALLAPKGTRVEAGAVLAAAYKTQDARSQEQRYQWLLRPSAAETAAAAAEEAAVAAEAAAVAAEADAAEARAVADAAEAAAAEFRAAAQEAARKAAAW